MHFIRGRIAGWQARPRFMQDAEGKAALARELKAAEDALKTVRDNLPEQERKKRAAFVRVVRARATSSGKRRSTVSRGGSGRMSTSRSKRASQTGRRGAGGDEGDGGDGSSGGGGGGGSGCNDGGDAGGGGGGDSANRGGRSKSAAVRELGRIRRQMQEAEVRVQLHNHPPPPSLTWTAPSLPTHTYTYTHTHS
jgi:hypothetical protein